MRRKLANAKQVLPSNAARALSGQDSHVTGTNVLDGLDWKIAGIRLEGVPHTLFQLVNHMIYWQEWGIKWLDGLRPKSPKHATGSWPGKEAPHSRGEWESAVRRFRKALQGLQQRSRQENLLSQRGKYTRLEMLHLIASHNSYHIGQAALLRQQMRAWPPPSGAVTW